MAWGPPGSGGPLGRHDFFRNILIAINISKCWAMHYISPGISALPPPSGGWVAGPGLGPISGLRRPLSLPSITCICSLHDLQTCKSCRPLYTTGCKSYHKFAFCRYKFIPSKYKILPLRYKNPTLLPYLEV